MSALTFIGPDDPALAVLDAVLKSTPARKARLVILPWAEYRSRLLETLQASQSPHQAVFIPGHVWLPELAQAGYLAALDEIALPGAGAARHPIQDFLAAMLPAVAEECRYQGKPYELPFFSDGHILFYRDDLLGEAVRALSAAATPVVSPLALAELAEKAHHPPEVYGLALKAHPSEILLDWLPYLWQAGGEILDETGRPAFAGPAGVQALEAYIALRRFCPPDTHLYGNAEIAAAIRDGRVALAATWGGQAGPLFGANPGLPYRCAVFPKPWNATWGIAIPANQPAKRQQQALGLLLGALNAECDRAVIPAAGSPVRRESYSAELLRTYPWLPAQQAMLERCGALPVRPETGRFLGFLYEAVYQAFTGKLAPQAALQAAEGQVRQITTRWRR